MVNLKGWIGAKNISIALLPNVGHHWARAKDATIVIPLDRVLQCMPWILEMNNDFKTGVRSDRGAISDKKIP